MDSLYIVMPAYNEEENIKEVVSSWYPLLSYYGFILRLRYLMQMLLLD